MKCSVIYPLCVSLLLKGRVPINILYDRVKIPLLLKEGLGVVREDPVLLS
jgi:hypothetical protein